MKNVDDLSKQIKLLSDELQFTPDVCQVTTARVNKAKTDNGAEPALEKLGFNLFIATSISLLVVFVLIVISALWVPYTERSFFSSLAGFSALSGILFTALISIVEKLYAKSFEKEWNKRFMAEPYDSPWRKAVLLYLLALKTNAQPLAAVYIYHGESSWKEAKQMILSNGSDLILYAKNVELQGVSPLTVLIAWIGERHFGETLENARTKSSLNEALEKADIEQDIFKKLKIEDKKDKRNE